MKSTKPIFLFMCLLFWAFHHSHTEEKIRGPHDGRVFRLDPLRAELVIQPDHSVEVWTYDSGMQPRALPDAEVEVIALKQPQPVSHRIRLSFRDGRWTADEKLPVEDGSVVVFRWKTKPDDSFTNIRFVYEAHICGGCDLREYACYCEH
jgi:hypothetical protein